MSHDLQFEGKNYISSKRAAQSCGYTQDYIGQLIRSKKIDARMVGRGWFVSEESILNYKKLADALAREKAGIQKEQMTEIMSAAPTPAAEVPVEVPSQPQFHYSADERSLLPELTKKVVLEDQLMSSVESAATRTSRFTSPFASDFKNKLVAGMISISVIAGTVLIGNIDNVRATYQALNNSFNALAERMHQSNLAAVSEAPLPEFLVSEPLSSKPGFFKSIIQSFNTAIASLFTSDTKVATVDESVPTSVVTNALSEPVPVSGNIVFDSKALIQPTSTPAVSNYITNTTVVGMSARDVALAVDEVRLSLQSQLNGLDRASRISVRNIQNAQERDVTSEIALSTISQSTIKDSSLSNASITGSSISGTAVAATSLSANSANLIALLFGTASGTDAFFVNGTTTNASSTNLYSDLLTVAGTISLQSATPVVTANKLYANDTDLYWAGNVIGGASTGNWTTNGTDAWRATGNVGVGTSSPFARLSVTSFNGGSVPLFAVSTSTGAGATSTAFIVDAYGSVGINTDNPNQLDFGGGVLAFKGRSNATTGSIVAIGNNVIGTNPIGRFAFIQEAAGVQTHVALVQALRSGGDDGADLNFMTKQSGGSLTEKMRITSDGKVGIGTSSPVALFTIASSTANATHLEAIRLSNSNPNGSGAYMFFERPGNSNRGFSIGEQYSPVSGLISYIRSAGALSEEIQIETAVNDVGTKGNLYIGSRNFSATAGKIGVATTTPWASLSIAGLAGQTNPLFVISSSTAAFSTSTAFIVDAYSNVGIGTTSPLVRLDVRDTAQIVAAFRGTNAHNTVTLDNLGGTSFKNQFSFQTQGTEKWAIGNDINAVGSDNFYIWNATGGRIPFAIDGTANTIVLSQSGSYKVGVASTSPWAQLSVNPNGVTGPSFAIGSSTKTDFMVTNAGNVGIGTTSPFAKLSVFGDTYVGGNLSATGTIQLDNNQYLKGLTSNGSGAFNIAGYNTNNDLVIGHSQMQPIIAADSSFKIFQGLFTIGNGPADSFANAGIALNVHDGKGITFSRNGSSGASGYSGVVGKITFLTPTSGFGTAPFVLQSVNSGGSFVDSIVMLDDRVGIASTSPWGKLSIANYGGSNPLFVIASSSAAIATTTQFIVDRTGNVGVGTTSPASLFTVVGGGACFSGSGATVACGNTAGNLYYRTANTGTYDVAENYMTSDLSVVAGDIVALDTTASSTITKAVLGSRVIGVVSTDPGLLLGGADGNNNGSTTRPVALSGRVPVKVNGENGNIVIGDKIALSSTAGVGRKAKGSEEVVGTALEAWSGGVSDTGTVMVFVSTKQHFDDDKFSIDQNGNIGIGTTTPGYKLQVMGDIAATSFVNISTRDAKHDISYLGGAEKVSILNRIKTIGIAQYRYNTESDLAPLRLGLIAEEAPVEILAAGGKGVDVYKLSTFILAGVQEMQATIEKMNLSVEDLKGRMTTVEGRLASLELFAETGGLAAVSASSTASTTIDTVSSYLASAGIAIDAVASKIMAIVTDTLTANFVVINNTLTVQTVHAESISSSQLRVGTSTNPAAAGITILDRATGQPYCMFVSNGLMQGQPGECATPIIPPVVPVENGSGSGNGTGGVTGGDTGTTTSGSGDTGTTTPDSSGTGDVVSGDTGTVGDTTGTTTTDGSGSTGGGEVVPEATPTQEPTPEPVPEVVPEPTPAPEPVPEPAPETPAETPAP